MQILRYSLQSLLFVLINSVFVLSQSQPPSDPQAVALASQSIAGLTGGNAVNDVTLAGSVIWSAGTTPETGVVTLLASGTGESRMNLSLPSGIRAEIRDASAGVPQGEWIAQDGSSGLFAQQNCATDAVWFFPALGSLAAGPNVVLTYVGLETRNGVALQHIQSYIYQPNPSGVSPSSQQLSTIDFYLDATTLLPVTMTYSAHPDTSANANLEVEVDFSNYQPLNGFLVPTRVQRYLQGNLQVDITLSTGAFNTGLALSDFTIQ
jgi:hypothetical protein